VRKRINPIWRRLLSKGTYRKVIVERYPELDKQKNYIFVGNHSFDEDIISSLSTIDRNAYLLHGTTDQMEHNPIFFAVWLNGMIYVNRLEPESRHTAVDKMERVLRAGNSVLLFPEGGYNNTENNLINPLFSSPHILSKRLGVEVVPIITFNDFGSDKIYIRAGNPINVGAYEKEEGLTKLRDVMATIVYEMMEAHTEPIRRADLGANCRVEFMEQRKKIYALQKWYHDVWDEELTCYSGHGITTPQRAREYVDNICVTKENAYVLADVLFRRAEDRKYDLRQYLRENLKLDV
jgi:1-acyl-sn-glycerol-3-phosphate acyltransferase